ncbi:MAG: CorA family divalent cation transporter, partial [Phycisphaerales bacterium]
MTRERDPVRLDSASHRRRSAGHRQAAPNLHLPPGTPSFDPHALPATIRLIRYSSTEFEERPIEDPAQLVLPEGFGGVTWVSVTGLGDAEALKTLAATFGIHPLAMEDILDITQPAKLEPFEDRVLLVLPRIDRAAEGLVTEQLSMLIGPHLVVTFEESPGSGNLERIRSRLREHRG